MQLVVIRHAIAEVRETFAGTGRPDGERPLSDRGVERMRWGARGLAAVLPGVDRLVSSPYVRAVQTAEILAEAYGLTVETSELLLPGRRPEEAAAWIAETAAAGDVSRLAIVGHEPSLSELVSYLLTGRDDAEVQLKKGSACLIDVGGGAPGEAALRWLLAPKHLRRLGGADA